MTVEKNSKSGNGELGDQPLEVLFQEARRIHQAQRSAWSQGRRVRVEDLLVGNPALIATPEALLDVVYGEFLLREEQGEEVRLDEYADRFPSIFEDLRRQIELHHAVNALPHALSPVETHAVHSQATMPGDQTDRGPIRIPGYHILDILGQGGMGIVYKARQIALDRLVAIKVLTAGPFANHEVRRRFRFEANAIAKIRHPNFVQIYDFGTTYECPYLVLEFVEAGNLAQKISGVSQPLEYAVTTIETLAIAMHHAHSLGIIHRDLKPANVLLTADQVLKITDFGLAKLRSESDDSHLLQTTSAAFVGTPAYMAPEQVQPNLAPIGPAADVHALGVILYELITGRVPFAGEDVVTVLQKVVSDEPIALRRLRPELARDLETICLKCLAKVPAKRYATASDLAADLQRYRTGRPIAARPSGWLERTVRWGVRNPAVATLAMTLGAAILAGLISTTCFWLRADRLRQAAEANLQQSKGNLELALTAVDRFCTHVSEDERLKQHDFRRLRNQLLQTAVEYHQEFIKQRADDPQAAIDLANAYTRLGSLTSEIDTFESALVFFNQAAGIFNAYRRAHPDDIDTTLQWARCENERSRVNRNVRTLERPIETLESVRDVVASLNNRSDYRRDVRFLTATLDSELGNCQREFANAKNAEEYYLRSISNLESLLKESPEDQTYSMALAGVYGSLGDHCQVSDIRRWRESGDWYRKALTIAEALAARAPDDVDIRLRVASLYRRVANNQKMGGQFEVALKDIRLGMSYLQKLVDEHPSVLVYREQLGLMLYDLGRVHATRPAPSEALDAYRRSVNVFNDLVKLDPMNAHYHYHLSRAECGLGSSFEQVGDPDAALPWMDLGIERLINYNAMPGVSDQNYVNTIGTEIAGRARVLHQLKRYDDALRDWDHCFATMNDAIMRPYYSMHRALTKAATSDYEQAIVEIKKYTRNIEGTGDGANTTRIVAARAFALAAETAAADTALESPQKEQRVSEYEREALNMMQTAADAGYSFGNTFENAREFDRLHSHPQYLAILERVKANHEARIITKKHE